VNHEDLHAYLDGELTPLEVSRVESALSNDPELAAGMAALRGLHHALEDLPGLDAPADFTQRVEIAVARRRRRGLLLRIALPAAAAAALVLAVFMPRGGVHDARLGETTGLFTTEERLDYMWEADSVTFGSGDLSELEDAIIAELESA